MKILIILICLPCFIFGQLSPKVKTFYDQLSMSKRAEGKNIGFAGSESDLYKIHEEMAKIATDEEVEYIAFNGNPVTKYYATNILFERKSKSLEKLFQYYLKSKDSVSVLRGCVGETDHLSSKIYTRLNFEKQIIKQTEFEKKWRDSMIINKQPMPDDYFDLFNTKTSWTIKEIDSLINTLDQIVLNDHKSPKYLVEIICGYHLSESLKVPYFEKIAYFEEKYNSEYIRKYMKFCRSGIREPMEY
ncbi:hypothetical protein [Chryseobacterium wanjuense]|uniref:hypothetical protein n=1 Tax=Chryseobacterium wanjuense TaxID=356305 RepID=UPI0011139AA7|nr:hypothetical protein [Chryseobacterium wanjuense]